MDSTSAQPVPRELVDRIDRDSEATVVYLSGELDLPMSPGLRKLLDAECERNPRRLRL